MCMYVYNRACIHQRIKDIIFLSMYTTVSLVSDELQELRQMRDATKLHIAQVMNIKPGVRKLSIASLSFCCSLSYFCIG